MDFGVLAFLGAVAGFGGWALYRAFKRRGGGEGSDSDASDASSWFAGGDSGSDSGSDSGGGGDGGGGGD